MNSSLSGIVAAYQSLIDVEREFVLATVVETRGSTYRKPGARMLVTKSGRFYGLLGGGCFEADLLEHVHKVFETQTASTVFYDMRAPEDLVWGLGLGCNGAVRIRLEYLSSGNGYTPLSLIQAVLESNGRALLITVCASEHAAIAAGSHYLFPAGAGEMVPEPFIEAAATMLRAGRSSLQAFTVDGSRVEAFLASIIPPTHLLIIGGSPDAVPVVQAANVLGWRVTVADHRETYSKPENFPGAARVVHVIPEQLAEKIDLSRMDAAVLMTHKYEYDLRFLENLAGATLPYIGLLGPVARKRELLQSTADKLPAGMAERIYGPVGMNIGGELPEEIAYSLVAEIQAVLHGRSGGHLTDLVREPVKTGHTEKLSVIILAAGGSTRFGALKQLLEYDGRSFLKRTVETALQLNAGEVLVVHGPKSTKCQREIAGMEVTNLINHEWETGLSSSLRLALDAVSPGTEAVLVLLCDQPLIRAEQLNRMIEIWSDEPEKIIAAEYTGTAGVPVILPGACFDAVRRLRGDTGAKRILAEFGEGLVTVPLPEAGFDIDTEQDFTDLLRKGPA